MSLGIKSTPVRILGVRVRVCACAWPGAIESARQAHNQIKPTRYRRLCSLLVSGDALGGSARMGGGFPHLRTDYRRGAGRRHRGRRAKAGEEEGRRKKERRKKQTKKCGGSIHINTKRMNAGDSVDVGAARKHHSPHPHPTRTHTHTCTVFLHVSPYLPPSPTLPTFTSERRVPSSPFSFFFIQLCTLRGPRLPRNEHFNATIKVRA